LLDGALLAGGGGGGGGGGYDGGGGIGSGIGGIGSGIECSPLNRSTCDGAQDLPGLGRRATSLTFIASTGRDEINAPVDRVDGTYRAASCYRYDRPRY